MDDLVFFYHEVHLFGMVGDAPEFITHLHVFSGSVSCHQNWLVWSLHLQQCVSKSKSYYAPVLRKNSNSIERPRFMFAYRLQLPTVVDELTHPVLKIVCESFGVKHNKTMSLKLYFNFLIVFYKLAINPSWIS